MTQRPNQPFDVSQAQRKTCICGCELYEKVFKMGLVSRLASRNTLNQDITVEYPMYVCRECGTEFNTGVKV